MSQHPLRGTVPRLVAVAGVAYLTVASYSYLSSVGLTGTGLALFVVAAALAWGGVAGVFRERVRLVALGLAALVVLGALNQALWTALLPGAAALFVAVLLQAVGPGSAAD